MIAKVFSQDTALTRFVKTIPGINEIFCLGKIYDLVNQNPNHLVIVDAPATGHFLSFMEMPQILKQVLAIGPLHRQAQDLESLLHRDTTKIFLTTLPEEFPILESIDLIKELRKLNLSPAVLFINKMILNFIECPTNKRKYPLIEDMVVTQREWIHNLEQFLNQEKNHLDPCIYDVDYVSYDLTRENLDQLPVSKSSFQKGIYHEK